MIDVFPECQHLLINLDTKPGNLTNPKSVADLTFFSDGFIETVQIVSSNTSHDGTTDMSVEASWTPSPHVNLSHVCYRH